VTVDAAEHKLFYSFFTTSLFSTNPLITKVFMLGLSRARDSGMIDLRKYRLIDLSEQLQPGIKKADGAYRHGNQTRRLEAEQWIYADDQTFMHWVDIETHVGTHVEGPSHYTKEGREIGEMALEKFMGEAVLVRLSDKKPRDPVTPDDLIRAGVKQNDIVLLSSPYKGEDRPCISPQASEWMSKTGIKMLGVDDSIVVDRGSKGKAGEMTTHRFLLGNDIPIVERLAHLDELSKNRFLFIGFPLRITGIDSSWIRAVAVEER